MLCPGGHGRMTAGIGSQRRAHSQGAQGAAALCGGVDVGGSKMLAQLYGPDMQLLAQRRLATPATDYPAFVADLAGLLGWLRAQGEALPVGVALAGAVDPRSGAGTAANLPIAGRALGGDLAALLGWAPVFVNDSAAFALSEAVDGAGAGAAVMVGLIIGTGMAAGLCVQGRLAPRAHGQAIEIGHVGMPQRALAPLGLGLRPCGCGQSGCIETYVTGAGLAALAEARIGRALSGEALAAALRAGDADARRLFHDWCGLLAEALAVVQMMHDPDVIVLGGGLSALPGLIPALIPAFARHGLPDTPRAALRLARHGGASGARGAALLARQAARC